MTTSEKTEESEYPPLPVSVGPIPNYYAAPPQSPPSKSSAPAQPEAAPPAPINPTIQTTPNAPAPPLPNRGRQGSYGFPPPPLQQQQGQQKMQNQCSRNPSIHAGLEYPRLNLQLCASPWSTTGTSAATTRAAIFLPSSSERSSYASHVCRILGWR